MSSKPFLGSYMYTLLFFSRSKAPREESSYGLLMSAHMSSNDVCIKLSFSPPSPPS